MVNLFTKILVPVDFLPTTLNTVERAVDLARQYRCSIHLLHVISDQPGGIANHDRYNTNWKPNANGPEVQLDRFIAHIQRISGNGVKATYSIERGAWNPRIIKVVNEKNYDLVLLGRPDKIARRKKWTLNADTIAAETNVPVMTIPGSRRLRKFYSILIPVTDFLPLRKLVYGTYMASNYHANVKLLGVEQAKHEDKTAFFLEKSFDLVRNSPAFEVNSEMSKNHFVAEAVEAMSINDLVILNPGMREDRPDAATGPAAREADKFADFSVLTVNPI